MFLLKVDKFGMAALVLLDAAANAWVSSQPCHNGRNTKNESCDFLAKHNIWTREKWMEV
jgi:hypothetical protein